MSGPTMGLLKPERSPCPQCLRKTCHTHKPRSTAPQNYQPVTPRHLHSLRKIYVVTMPPQALTGCYACKGAGQVACPVKCFLVGMDEREPERECAICDGDGTVMDEATGLGILCPRAPSSRSKFGLTTQLSCYGGFTYPPCVVCKDFKMAECTCCRGSGKLVVWVDDQGKVIDTSGNLVSSSCPLISMAYFL